MNIFGAQKRTRTSTALRPLAPEASASTNSAIWAHKRCVARMPMIWRYIKALSVVCQRISVLEGISPTLGGASGRPMPL